MRRGKKNKCAKRIAALFPTVRKKMLFAKKDH